MFVLSIIIHVFIRQYIDKNINFKIFSIQYLAFKQNFDAIHVFLVWLRTGSNIADINRFENPFIYLSPTTLLLSSREGTLDCKLHQKYPKFCILFVCTINAFIEIRMVVPKLFIIEYLNEFIVHCLTPQDFWLFFYRDGFLNQECLVLSTFFRPVVFFQSIIIMKLSRRI